MRALPRWIFMSRWLQAPLYVGLIVAQGIYVWQFWKELIHLIGMMTVEKNGHRNRTYADCVGLNRRGDDLKPFDHGHRWRLGDVCLEA